MEIAISYLVIIVGSEKWYTPKTLPRFYKKTDVSLAHRVRRISLCFSLTIAVGSENIITGSKE